MLSVLAVQLSATEAVDVEAVRFVGTDGAVVSIVHVAVAGVASATPLAVA